MLIDASFVFLIFYFLLLSWLVWGVFSLRYRSNSPVPVPKVTIVVAARNEEQHITACINALIQQTYPVEKLQILIIDDNSSDHTYQIADEFAASWPHMHVIKRVRASEWKSSKKGALAQAIVFAKGDILCFTDADCVPPKTWVQQMVSEFEEDTGLVAGYSPQVDKQSKLWNGFLHIDSLYTAFVAAGTIGWDKGVTCTGRNLAVKSCALHDIGGYEHLPDTISGDDDFVLQLIAKNPNWKIHFSMAPGSHVPAVGPGSFQEFINQKKRHLSAGKHFNFGQKVGFAVYHILNFSIWTLAVIGIFTDKTLLTPFYVKICLDLFALIMLAASLNERLNIFLFLYWEFMFPIYHLLAGPGAMFGKVQWKPSIKKID